MRYDDPNTNPAMRLDTASKPARPVREFWSADLEPKKATTAKHKADSAPKSKTDTQPRMTEEQARHERQKARRDAALSEIKGLHKRREKGTYQKGAK
ncbi:hypothetical protein [Thioalkalivibrio sp. HL-Eb18]|uniref:hypothetical protein n=1 Tax=Thioalkalivibrio sp. HL-Eb18 TaxID=1266913 RepID=UPI0003668D5E|nr:hypothetical protein [Thioalkalivibrio sp. HL-Eb18]